MPASAMGGSARRSRLLLRLRTGSNPKRSPACSTLCFRLEATQACRDTRATGQGVVGRQPNQLLRKGRGFIVPSASGRLEAGLRPVLAMSRVGEEVDEGCRDLRCRTVL